MYPWVTALVLILLLTDSVMSYTELTVVEGQSVTLQCTYSGSITTTCWGRGACSTFSCSDYIIRTDGYNVIFQKDPRYLLKGNIGHGDVSLTIVNVKLSDSGVYCCRVELAGWFNDLIVTYTLKVRPAPPTTTAVITTRKTTVTTTPKTTTTTTQKTTVTTTPKTTTTTTPETTVTTTPKTTVTMTPKTTVTIAPTTGVSTSAPPMPATTETVHTGAALTSPSQQEVTLPITTQNTMTSSLMPSCSTDGNITTTQFSDGLQQNNQTSVVLEQSHWLSKNQGVYIGIGVTAIVLLLICLTVIIAKRYICLGSKVELLRIISFKDIHFGALKNMSVKHVRAEDNIYIIEDSH
ncbi:hepatitis A virus cellular receptor 1 precursor [Sus scrofa]|uniref:Hepatitis A virus cellular receptor 1 n=2 Tax=Sus scrofa TaxID=9823 RepID=A0A8D0RIR9_PIG|nr:hepatitis A virus cellular receptor 1 precursor [Sus scrofa]ACV32782.1 hepatitis A virus cellular receptor 1 [Sus scrofa]